MSIKTHVAALAAAATLVLSASGAHAATTTFNFNQILIGNRDSISYTIDGIGLTITAGTFSSNSNPSTIDFATRRVSRDFIDGLGADGRRDIDEVDGRNGNDVLVFTFDTLVRVEEIEFSPFDIDGNDDFAFGSVSGGQFDRIVDFQPVSTPFNVNRLGGNTGVAFGVGAIGRNDNFSITDITVSQVPLPAAGWMFLTGLGGLAAIRRRQKMA